MTNNPTTGGRSLVVIGASERTRQAPGRTVGGYPDAVFEAQRLGQPGQKRGLRGGAPVLEAARGAYLSAEFAGCGDRRPAPGLLTVREI